MPATNSGPCGGSALLRWWAISCSTTSSRIAQLARWSGTAMVALSCRSSYAAAVAPRRARTVNGPAPSHRWRRGGAEHVVDIALDRRHRREPPLRRQGQRRAEEVDPAVAVLGGPVEHRPDELLGRIDLRALSVARRHFSSAERAPASSALLPSRACRPARSPARRAADEYPAVALGGPPVPARGCLAVEVSSARCPCPAGR